MRLSIAFVFLAAVAGNLSNDGLVVEAKMPSKKNLRGKVSGEGLNTVTNRQLKKPKSSKGVQLMAMPDGGDDLVPDSTIVVADSDSTDSTDSSEEKTTTTPDNYADDTGTDGTEDAVDEFVGDSIVKEDQAEEDTDVFCTMDAMDCGNGISVGRDPANGCQFFACPPEADAAPTAQPPTYIQSRSRPPTKLPTQEPTTAEPSATPTLEPTTEEPTTAEPSDLPTSSPVTDEPTTAEPSDLPTASPVTDEPTTAEPSDLPTASPVTDEPTTAEPSDLPTSSPVTDEPTTAEPSDLPTASPVTDEPTDSPVAAEADGSTRADDESSPVAAPTAITDEPVEAPVSPPTVESAPVAAPTVVEVDEVVEPTAAPVSDDPTLSPTYSPTTEEPSALHSSAPSLFPTTPQPTDSPTQSPTPMCAGVMVRAQDCGAENKNRPQSCCAGLVCADVNKNNRAYMHCVEPTVEDVVEMIIDEMAPTTEAPVGPPTAKPTLAPVAPPTPAPVFMGNTDTCAALMERAVSCGADNSDRPHNCCPGLVCSDNSQGSSYRCVEAPVADTSLPSEAVEGDTTPTEENPPTPIAPEASSTAEEMMPAVTEDEGETLTTVDDEGCGIEVETLCFSEEDGVEGVDCRSVSTTTLGADEMMDVTWSYTLRNTCTNKWTVIARQNLQSCDLCLKSGLVCEKTVDFFQATEDNCAQIDETGRYLGFPPGCSITENVEEQVQVGSEENGRCMYTKEVNLRVIERDTATPVDNKYSFVAPMSWNV